MRLYLCTSEQGIRRAEYLLGYRPGQDLLVLVHDAVYTPRRGERIAISASDLALRGLRTNGKGISDAELLRLIMEHEQVIIP